MKKFAFFALCLLVSCSRDYNATTGDELKITQDVINLWQTNVNLYEATNTLPKSPGIKQLVHEQDMLYETIAKQLSDNDRDLILGDAIRYDPTNGVMNHIYDDCIIYYVRTGDRKRLVNTLSKRCDYCISINEMVEFSICWRGQVASPTNVSQESLTNAFGVFFEAYQHSQSPQVKSNICKAVRRAMAGYGIDSTLSDDQFMAAAEKWRAARWLNLKVIPDYDSNTGVGLFGPDSEIELNPN